MLTGGDGRVCDTPQLTSIAAADGEVHDEPIFAYNGEDHFITSQTDYPWAAPYEEVTLKAP